MIFLQAIYVDANSLCFKITEKIVSAFRSHIDQPEKLKFRGGKI